METLIVCLGNENNCDDGIGAIVGRVLQSLPMAANIKVRMVGEVSVDLMDEIASTEELVLVDALHSGGQLGTCTVVDVTEVPPSLAGSECAHDTQVVQILDFVRYIACDGTPCRVAIAGIEGRQFLASGAFFSEDVCDAVPRLADLVLLFAGANLEARIAVKEACRRLSWLDCAKEDLWLAERVAV